MPIDIGQGPSGSVYAPRTSATADEAVEVLRKVIELAIENTQFDTAITAATSLYHIGFDLPSDPPKD
jgi:hypothetical protein